MLNLRSSSKPVYLSFTALKFQHRRHIYLNYHKRPKKSDSKKSSPEKPWKRFNAGRFRKPVPFLTEMKNCQDSDEAISLFMNIMKWLARARNFEVVATFLDYLRTLDIRCQEPLFIALFQHYGKAKMPHQAIELFHKMKSFNCPRTLQSFNTILNVLVDNNFSAEAAEMFKRSSKMGFRPNSVTFNIMIKMWLQKCEWERAKEVFDEMLDREVEPTVVSYNSLIGFLCKKGEFNEAKLLFDDMVKKRRSPNHVTYALLMEGLCFLGKFKEAKNMMFYLFKCKLLIII
ncbi:hypothetical protein M9H77_29223 [Catharanthus roseus]|uniref:Uncharacterized protein n=1 Tax=Catharanthus roseus TaxID=4058 RepID=A0ACC0AHU5_CATRO|nr:hypothetical protein M9H77_29223 [Catharanthus roseus]